MSEPLEVTAEVIEPVNLAKAPEPAITYTLPSATVGNLEEVEAFVGSVEAFFAGVEIDVDDPDQVKQLKALRADVNKVAKAIDDKRKAMDREIKGAVAEADSALNSLRDRMKSVYDATGKRIDEANERQKQARLNILAREYEAVAPDLVALIPLESFVKKEPKLVSRDKRFTGDKACDMLDAMIADAVHDRARLREGDVAFADEADMVYCRTLDLRAALDESDRLKKLQAEREAHKAAAARLDAAVEKAHEVAEEANQPAPEQVQPKPAHAPQEASAPVKTWRLEFDATRSDAERVRDFIKTIPGAVGRSFKAVTIDA